MTAICCKLYRGIKIGVLSMNVFQMRDLLKDRLKTLDANFKFDRKMKV